MIQLSEQPTIDINKIVQRYQTIISEIQLQNILLNIRVEELHQQLAAQLATQALEDDIKNLKREPHNAKNSDWGVVPSSHL